MSNPSLRPILIAAGGTGGHMFPGVALARTLSDRGHRVAFVSDARGAAVSRENLGLPPEIERYAVTAGRLGTFCSSRSRCSLSFSALCWRRGGSGSFGPLDT